MLFGTLTVVFDIVQVTYRRLPFIVSGTVIAVFSLIAYAFRAALAPDQDVDHSSLAEYADS